MTINANVVLDKKEFTAELSDGQHIAQADLKLFASALHRAGVCARDTQYDRRDGHRMLTAGQQVALNAALRQLERPQIKIPMAA